MTEKCDIEEWRKHNIYKCSCYLCTKWRLDIADLASHLDRITNINDKQPT